MHNEKLELAASISNEIQIQLVASLDAFRRMLKESGKLDPDFRAYIAFDRDGSSETLNVDEMSTLVLERPDDILLTLYFWIIKDNFENLFGCCEMCDSQGIKKWWVAKINIEAGENGNWLDQNQMPNSLKSYFADRMNQLNSIIESNNIFPHSTTFSKYGAN